MKNLKSLKENQKFHNGEKMEDPTALVFTHYTIGQLKYYLGDYEASIN